MSRKRVGWWLLLGLTTALLAGCVTEKTGGLPDPASTQTRLEAQLDLARGYLEQGNSERARTSLNRALAIDPHAVEAHVLLAVLNTTESNWEIAERHFKRALSLDSRDAMALNNYASFLYSRDRYQEAERYLKILVEDAEYRARAQAYENLGLVQLKLGEAAAARDSFQRALQLSFTQPQSSLELAQMAYDEGDIDEAASYYDGFRSQAQQTARSLCLGMKIAQRQGEPDRMASYAMALNNLFPDSPEVQECNVPR